MDKRRVDVTSIFLSWLIVENSIFARLKEKMVRYFPVTILAILVLGACRQETATPIATPFPIAIKTPTILVEGIDLARGYAIVAGGGLADSHADIDNDS